jgi:hypothetical protein
MQEPAPAKAGVSITTSATKPKGGQFVLHAKALHGNPFDGHTLGPVVTELERLTGVETRRIHFDTGYRGHNHKEKFRVWISGQVRRVTAPIRREMKRRAAVEPVIGHTKAEHRMGRNYLKGRDGDRINAVLAGAGYNFGLILRWLARLLRALIRALIVAPPGLKNRHSTVLHRRLVKGDGSPVLPWTAVRWRPDEVSQIGQEKFLLVTRDTIRVRPDDQHGLRGHGIVQAEEKMPDAREAEHQVRRLAAAWYPAWPCNLRVALDPVAADLLRECEIFGVGENLRRFDE